MPGSREASDTGREGGIRIPVRRLDGLVEDGTMTVLGPLFLKIDVEVWDCLGAAGYRMLAVRAGIPASGVEPDIVNYLCIPDIGKASDVRPLDVGALDAVLDEWASQTETR